MPIHLIVSECATGMAPLGALIVPQLRALMPAFAHLCGAAPIPASSGRTHRHRLNRGGDRAANNALYVVVLGRLRYDPRTRAYAERRTHEDLSKPEIIRCLKHYVARELYNALRTLVTNSRDPA
jgi:transposase